MRCPTSLSISLQLTHHQKFVIFFSILPCNISLSTFIAINLPSYHFLILKKCVIQHLFPQPLQLTHNLIICELSHISFHIHCNRLAIICEFSNCALSCISFHIDCNRLAILSFSNLKIVRCPAIHSTFIAFVNFQIVSHIAPISTFIAIDKPFYHFLILKFCVVLHLFQH